MVEHESHGRSGHGGEGAVAWMERHLGGIVMPFGERVEALLERMLALLVNGLFSKIAFAYLIVFTPVLVIEFLLHALA